METPGGGRAVHIQPGRVSNQAHLVGEVDEQNIVEIYFKKRALSQRAFKTGKKASPRFPPGICRGRRPKSEPKTH